MVLYELIDDVGSFEVDEDAGEKLRTMCTNF